MRKRGGGAPEASPTEGKKKTICAVSPRERRINSYKEGRGGDDVRDHARRTCDTSDKRETRSTSYRGKKGGTSSPGKGNPPMSKKVSRRTRRCRWGEIPQEWRKDADVQHMIPEGGKKTFDLSEKRKKRHLVSKYLGTTRLRKRALEG